MIVQYTDYEWWLLNWVDNQLMCIIHVDHEGVPDTNDVYTACGKALGDQWFTTPACKINKEGQKVCQGLYLHLVSTQPKEKEVIVELPPPTAWVNLEGCTPAPPDNLCPEIPVLVITGEEPLPEHQIISIQGTYDEEPFYCAGAVCQLPLRATALAGSKIEFWAESSYGDRSETFSALVRVIDTGVSPAPGGAGWYVDVISSQWTGPPLASCSRIWEVFPPVGGTPPWLSTPDGFQLLGSDEPYFYLAGRLISQGLIDTSACLNGGLLPNGYADACGLEKSRPLIDTWQNQFDARILEVSKETGVPAQLMKNLFAQESQFWPNVFRVPYEFGLGQITENGADSVLLWNTEFYDQFCPLVLSVDTCANRYLSLTEENRTLLRGALALQAKTDCPDCPTGVDMSQANFSVKLFANTLQANCAQVARIIYTATNSMAGQVSTYDDLWRFTIANYHAGPGCLSYAIHQAWATDRVLTWQGVSTRFTDPCKGVTPYVDKISSFP